MNKKLAILKEKLKEKINYKKDYSHTIILEEKEEGKSIFITQFIPLKVYKGSDLYAAIHIQSIEIDPSFPNTLYFYQYTNKVEENEKKTFGFNTPTFENGWSRSISSIKGKMKVKERLEKGEILIKDTFFKLKPLVINWDDHLKPNTRKKETTMYKIHWLEAGEGIHYLFKEVLDYRYDGRIIVDNTEDLEDIKDFLLDDEEYEYLGVSQNLLFIDFLELLKEDKEALEIVRLLTGEYVDSSSKEDEKEEDEEEDFDEEKEDVPTPASSESTTLQPYTSPSAKVSSTIGELGPVSPLHPTHLTILLDKLIDCEVDVPEEDTKYLINYLMTNYKGNNLKYIINKLTEE